MIIDKCNRLFELLTQMRRLDISSAARRTYAYRILPKYYRTECPAIARKYLAREIQREQQLLRGNAA